MESESDSSSSSTPSSSSPSTLKFSISRILEDDFGSSNKRDNMNENIDESSLLPAWVYSTRYSDRPTCGLRSRRPKRKESSTRDVDDKRPRTAFTPQQQSILRRHFMDNRYLTEKRRQELAHELGLNECQIKIWFQNKRAKIKKVSMDRPALSSLLISQNLCIPSQSP